jgi:UDP-GlcNAc:undecaprenyl-phosphate/decaprenyl-phosphate GlcNAc-1-phosphate transferase
MAQYEVLYVVALLGSLALAAAATPIVNTLAVRWGALDQPGERKIHTSPIPRLGGLAIWLALWLAALWGVRSIPPDGLIGPASTLPQLLAIFAGATVILVVGTTDDSRGHMKPLTKLAGQTVACSVLIAMGIRVNVFGVNWLDVPLTYLWVIGLTNALNLLDNMDGLSAGATTIASAFFFVLAVLNGQILVSLLAAALVGSCLGFLVYNYNPASIFMGDSGSLSLGFMLAVLGMKLQIQDAPRVSFLLAALVLSVPIFDTTFVVWRRLKGGRQITVGAKDHTSHCLLNLGLSQKQAVWALYGASFLAGMAALVASHGTLQAVVGAGAFGVLLVCAGIGLARADSAIGLRA